MENYERENHNNTLEIWKIIHTRNMENYERENHNNLYTRNMENHKYYEIWSENHNIL